MALLNGGYTIDDPEGHSKRILTFLQSQLGLESLKLQPHAELPVEEDVPPEVGEEEISIDIDELLDEPVPDKGNGDEL